MMMMTSDSCSRRDSREVDEPNEVSEESTRDSFTENTENTDSGAPQCSCSSAEENPGSDTQAQCTANDDDTAQAQSSDTVVIHSVDTAQYPVDTIQVMEHPV